MAITTHLTPYYKWKTLIVAVMCIVFGVWGAYDYFIAIPQQQALYDQVQTLEAAQVDLESRQSSTTGEERAALVDEYDRIVAELNELKADGEPAAPGKWDRAVQIVFMLCLPFGIYYLWVFMREKNLKYTLQDDGTLVTPTETVAPDQIKDIDMSRWMAKSIATIETTDGRQIKLDDYVHKNTHLIVGTLAHERYPEQWHPDARQVKGEAEKTETEVAEPDSVAG